LTLSGGIIISDNSTELAGGGIFSDPATIIFDSTNGHPAIFNNRDSSGLNAIAFEGAGNVMKFIGGAKALPGGVIIRDSIRALDGSTNNVIEISYTNTSDFVQFGNGDGTGSVTHTLGLDSQVHVNSGIMRLVKGAAFDAGGIINVDTVGTLAGGGKFIATNFNVAGTLRPDNAELTISSSIIGIDKLIGEMTLKGSVNLNAAKIAVELKGTDVSDKVVVDGNLTYGAENIVDVNSWSEGTFTVLESANGVELDKFTLKIGSERLPVNSRQKAELALSPDGKLQVNTEMPDTMRRRLTWTGNKNSSFDITATNNWVDDFGNTEQFNHTDYLVFNDTGKQDGSITLGGGRTVSGMLISDGNYNFTGGDLFGISRAFDYGSGFKETTGGNLIIAGGNIGFENNVYFEGNIEILNRANVTLSWQKAFHTESDFILGENASLTLDVGDYIIRGKTVTLDGTVNLTKDSEPLPTTHRRPVFHNMITATDGGLDVERLEEIFNFTQGLLNRESIVSVDGTAMDLQYTATPLSEYAAEFGFTHNQTEAARYLEAAFDAWEWEDFELKLMNMDDSQLASTFAFLSNGAIHAEAKMTALSNPYRIVSQRFFEGNGSRTIDPRQRCGDYSTRGFWFAASQSDRRQDGDGQARSYGISRIGMNVGLDKYISRSFSVGFIFNYGNPRLYQDGNRVKSDDHVFGLFAKKQFGGVWEANGFLAYGSQNYRGNRAVSDGVVQSKYDGDSWYLTTELVRRVKLTREFTVLPTAAIDIQSAKSGAFAETGTSQFRQVYGKSDLSQTVMRFGINSQWRMNDRARIDTRLQYGRQIGGSDTPSIQSVFAESSVNTPMTFNGVKLGRDILNVGVGGRYFLTKSNRGIIFGNYDLDRGNRSLTHSAEMGFQYWW
ncbi:MAG: autotransporter outer membrane beta-barrel domain-containing protein, partial [Planctomycetaceae bacterium]|nr:autotransporter outer membrane beta-barrel domain-containing protein [Planctomycetaceae bacterium]